ncbi:MAG: rRNA adenine N(6)-methyltransferase family protein [Dehalococcoidales bacterium]|jgi:23S rRNA (adenine-N6)-dimethyltransferase
MSRISFHQYSRYSQNESINKNIIQSLINQSSISAGDLVYDIGAGAGNITEALLAKGARVIAIEKDAALYRRCRARFLGREAAAIHHADFLHWEFSPGHRYKVFANIPFIQTAAIVKKLVSAAAPPEDCYLIMQKEAAVKYAGVPGDTLASLLIKPMFWVDIVYHFKRDDFSPAPAVDIVLLQMEKRRCRLVPENLYGVYRDFIVFCREAPAGGIGKVLKDLFPAPQLKQIAAVLEIDLRGHPADLSFMQYLGIFQSYLGNDLNNIALVQGAEARLRQRRLKMKTVHRTVKK